MTTELLLVAQIVSDRLDAQERTAWRRWLKEPVGALGVFEREALAALAGPAR